MLSRECAARGVKPQKVSRIMRINLTRKQIVDLLFSLELAEDNAPGMRRWEELRSELRAQLAVLDTENVFVDRFAEDPEPYSDLDGMEVSADA